MTHFPPKPERGPSASADNGSGSQTIAQILRVLKEGERFLVCSHSRPDGDAVGSMLAFGMLLEQMGKRADLVTADRVPVAYRRLPGVSGIRSALRVHGPCDAAILLECDGLERTRLRGLEEFFLINIDHHVSGRAYAQVNWIDYGAASVGEMVHRLVKAAGATVTPEMATCLYTTVLTDTGSFSYGALSASTFALARELVLAGADPAAIAQEVYYSMPLAKVMLAGAALGNLQREDRLAWLWITQEDMARTQAAEEDCEGIVNFALGIAGVEAAVFLRELPEGRIRLSLRGKGKVNVAAIAGRLGGGGHENAAGCTLEGPLERALAEILAELRPAIAAIARPD
jgi:bifunctional oligoribonuclease and PAP phosphatase NrnA